MTKYVRVRVVILSGFTHILLMFLDWPGSHNYYSLTVLKGA